MSVAKIATALVGQFEGRILPQAAMKEFTSWQIGGPAELLVIPKKIEDLCLVLTLCQQEGIPCLVIGKGSNLLVSDKGIKGVVIQIGDAFSQLELLVNYRVRSGAGLGLAMLANETAKAGYSGLEWAAGIPGSVGGAILMNAGAYGSSIGPFVTKVEVVEYNGSRRTLTGEELSFAYRQSGIDQKTQVVTSVELQLAAGKKEESMAEIRRLLALRNKNQPLEYPSAGSVFKNPEGDHAGRLSEAAGCRGMQVGGAQVSLKHGNFIVNLGDATAKDVKTLISKVQEEVRRQFGIVLEPEVRMVGE